MRMCAASPVTGSGAPAAKMDRVSGSGPRMASALVASPSPSCAKSSAQLRETLLGLSSHEA